MKRKFVVQASLHNILAITKEFHPASILKA